MITKNDILDAWKKYSGEVDWEVWVKNERGAFGQFEGEVLYSIIRLLQPNYIVEISPDRGFTTKIMIDACNKNEQGCEIYSFDLKPHSNHLNQKEKVIRDLIVGDVRSTIKDEHIENCDFMFIDSDHSYDFGKWYSENLLSKLKEETFIWVHDWPTFESDGSPCNICPEFNPAWNARVGEVKAVKEHFINMGLGQPIMNCTDVLIEQGKVYHSKQSSVSPSQILIRKNNEDNSDNTESEV